ncbi:FecR family protein [Sphingobacterium psychroaquaticum]|uniref:FecR family protein n=1 Tax=Sphingobacterium psychroaquaticum TaxID=561061 RepID=A0A1X7J0Q5_9SPHI|nr:FecR family protein [Sphingobacterium psychroaquaticum]SMG21056.1 FecR family protein [Sphingobacterium psychroaquaticum]
MKDQEQSNQARELLQKYLDGTATEEESAQVLRWFYSFENTPLDTHTELDEFALNKKMNAQLQERLFTGETISLRKKRWKKPLLVAATLLCCSAIALSIFIYRQYQEQEHHTTLARMIDATSPAYTNDIMPGGHYAKLTYADGKEHISRDSTFVEHHPKGGNTSQQQVLVEVPKAGTFQLLLEDGTKVWLNASTHLSYPDKFANNNRTIQLDGEAYFEVAKDPKRPFRIQSNGTIIEVLGTSFNVQAYNEKVSAALVEGSVKIKKGNHENLLIPGQQAEVNGEEILITEIDVAKSTAWQRGEFYFDGTNFDEIIQQVGRWYDVEFENNTSLQTASSFKGTINRKAPLSSVLDILKIATGKSFTIHGRKVRIT